MNFEKAQLLAIRQICYLVWRIAYRANNNTLMYFAAIYGLDTYD